jgi:sialate O-acetylesterase
MGLWALAEVYGRPTEGYESPSFKNVEKVTGPEGGNALRITFNQTGTGLKTRDGKELDGFALRGPDGKFEWAEARIENGGTSVIVWSAGIPDPTEACFAWQNNPVRANLVNSAGLPADPFRAQWPETK